MKSGAVHLVIDGDFNCLFSALASSRAAHLGRTGAARVEWRAVEHDPDIPLRGEPVRGALALSGQIPYRMRSSPACSLGWGGIT